MPTRKRKKPSKSLEDLQESSAALSSDFGGESQSDDRQGSDAGDSDTPEKESDGLDGPSLQDDLGGEGSLEIQWIPIDAIKPYWRNPRYNDEGVDKVQSSIEEFGCQQPIVLDSNLTIVAGHTRYKALSRLGWEKAPCVVAENLDEEKARAYRIADNATRDWSTWDTALLSEELQSLEGGDLSDLMRSVLTLDVDDLLKQSVGSSEDSSPPSQEEIEEQEKELQESMDGRGGEKQEETMREIRCPHCSETFLVDIK